VGWRCEREVRIGRLGSRDGELRDKYDSARLHTMLLLLGLEICFRTPPTPTTTPQSQYRLRPKSLVI
jgi:hypothetical protein